VSHWKHYDFIEVGTSDWGTLTQYCAGVFGHHPSPLAAEIRTSLDGGSLHLARGLAVEAVWEHIEALPQLPRVYKEVAAVDEHGGEATVYTVSAENVEKHAGMYTARLDENDPDTEVDVMWYAKSMSSVGRPHPELQMLLRQVGRLDLLEQRTIPALSWRDICFRYGVGTVDVVQLDCEGMDCAILRGMLAYCEYNAQSLPRLIQFEANHLTSDEEIESIVQALSKAGYTVKSRDWCNVVVER